MRENLYRGKLINRNKVWFEGSLLNIDEDSGHVFIVPPFNGSSTFSVWRLAEYSSVCVAPETVGQYTGLHDNNGKKIFEDDVVELSHEAWLGARGVVVFLRGAFCIKAGDLTLSLYAFRKCCEVIGNIHDHPELLGGAK